MSKKLSVNGFKWLKIVIKFDEDIIKNYYADSNKGHILEVDVEYLKNLLNLHSDLPFLAERKKIKNAISLFGIEMTKKNTLFT